MKGHPMTLAAILPVIAAAMWNTPERLATIMEWILRVAVIPWFLPNPISA
jgi:hypothetical protein